MSFSNLKCKVVEKNHASRSLQRGEQDPQVFQHIHTFQYTWVMHAGCRALRLAIAEQVCHWVGPAWGGPCQHSGCVDMSQEKVTCPQKNPHGDSFCMVAAREFVEPEKNSRRPELSLLKSTPHGRWGQGPGSVDPRFPAGLPFPVSEILEFVAFRKSGKHFQQFSRNFPGVFLENPQTDPGNSHSLLEFLKNFRDK